MSDRASLIQRWLGNCNVNCVQLIYALYREHGISLPGKHVSKVNVPLLSTLLKMCFYTVKEDLQLYDIVLFHIHGSYLLLHCGVYLGEDQFMHALGKRGVRVDSFTRWTPQYFKAYRLRGHVCQQQ